MLNSDKIDRKTSDVHARLRQLPGVDQILELAKTDPFFSDTPKSVLVGCVRTVIDRLRTTIRDGTRTVPEERLRHTVILESVKAAAAAAMRPNLRRVVNATGIVVHTNLGRSLLAPEALSHLATVAGRYSNLEFDLASGHRGSRYSAVEEIICGLCGAESALVVNNNAGAVLLCLETLARGKEVIVSRGELVEIGGSFRIPDVMAKSGGILKEVGTTNRTHLADYTSAITAETALLLKVHRSNYSVVGFTAEVSLNELVALGARHRIPVMEDLGSGTLIDFSKYGLQKEPTVQESVKTGADVVTFSGDKLLGGPQAGIISGKKPIVDQIKKNPLTRALRIDKLTLAALESTLRLYWDEEKALEAVPTLRMLTLPASVIDRRAKKLVRLLKKTAGSRMEIHLRGCVSRSGGGALPLLDLPSKCVAVSVSGMSVNRVEKRMRSENPSIIGRIEDDRFVMDVRTLQDDELEIVQKAFENLLKRNGS